MQYANVAISASCSVQSEIVPCARALRQTQPVPCQSTYEWMCARRGHSIARGECMQSSNHLNNATDNLKCIALSCEIRL